jgi:hypothetical protein
MNKDRIEELAEQAAEYCKTQPREIAGAMWERKFAELIIRECAKVADANYDKGFRPVGLDILEHFGVEPSSPHKNEALYS